MTAFLEWLSTPGGVIVAIVLGIVVFYTLIYLASMAALGAFAARTLSPDTETV